MNAFQKVFFKLTFFFALMQIMPSRLAGQAGSRVLNIEVTGLRNNKGRVLITVFKSAEGFPGSTKNAVFNAEVIPKNNVARIAYEQIVDGTYAMAVLHDENGNTKMDMNFLGLPKEGYGFSQNAMGSFGPPTFKKASFQFPAQKLVSIKIRY